MKMKHHIWNHSDRSYVHGNKSSVQIIKTSRDYAYEIWQYMVLSIKLFEGKMGNI